MGMKNKGKVEDGRTCAFLEIHPKSFNPETQAGGGAQRLPPLHVSGLQHCLLSSLLCCGGLWVHSYHLLIHVLAGLRPFSGNLQLVLEVSAVVNSV